MSDHSAEQCENSVARPQDRHLKPWRPGQSGNPDGRPKGSVSLVEILRQKLGLEAADGRTEAEAIVDALITEAKAGDFKHIKEVLERIDGKVAEKHELTGKDGGPLEIEAADRAAASAELDQWRKQMTERLASLPAAPPAATQSNTPNA